MYGSLRQNLHNFFYTDEGRTDITDYRDAIASKKKDLQMFCWTEGYKRL